MRVYVHPDEDDMADPDEMWPEPDVEPDNEQPAELGAAPLGLARTIQA